MAQYRESKEIVATGSGVGNATADKKEIAARTYPRLVEANAAGGERDVTPSPDVIFAEVPDGKGFKQEAKRPKVIHEVTWADAHSRMRRCLTTPPIPKGSSGAFSNGRSAPSRCGRFHPYPQGRRYP